MFKSIERILALIEEKYLGGWEWWKWMRSLLRLLTYSMQNIGHQSGQFLPHLKALFFFYLFNNR